MQNDEQLHHEPGIKVDIISTDRHPQIKKDMRVNHADIDHQFDPWHLAKSVSKKLSAASKKAGCSDLAPWIPSIINHLWWCAESCNEDAEVLHEKWLSVIHHVTNRHSWPGNKHFHKCDHDLFHKNSSVRRSGSSLVVQHQFWKRNPTNIYRTCCKQHFCWQLQVQSLLHGSKTDR